MRYLGNKTRMIENISSFIDELNIEGKVFCDLFAGSASVADYFKDKYQIIANDLLESSYIFASAKTSFGKTPTFKKFKEKIGCNPFKYFTNKTYDFDETHFIWMNYSPKGGRQFFTEDVANKIDGIRLELEQFYEDDVISKKEYDFLLASLLETVMGLSNTTGTYEAFLKDWDKRSFKNFELLPLEMKEVKLYSKNNVVYNHDSNELIKQIEGDILYLDTPYTITDYNSAYHLLETIVKYDKPDIKGITGRRVNKPEKSKYSIKNKVATAYDDYSCLYCKLWKPQYDPSSSLPHNLAASYSPPSLCHSNYSQSSIRNDVCCVLYDEARLKNILSPCVLLNAGFLFPDNSYNLE